MGRDGVREGPEGEGEPGRVCYYSAVYADIDACRCEAPGAGVSSERGDGLARVRAH